MEIGNVGPLFCEGNSFWLAGICSAFKLETVVCISRCADKELYVEKTFMKIQAFLDIKPCHTVNT
jgi:hypothetical protein